TARRAPTAPHSAWPRGSACGTWDVCGSSLTPLVAAHSMSTMAVTQLVVISGPIGSGKSSTAQRLAARARDERRTAAVVDLDLLYMMLDDASPMSNASVW